MGDNLFYKNKDYLLQGGNLRLKKDILDITEHAINAVIPYDKTKELISLSAKEMQIGNETFPVKEKTNFYFIGAGKGSFPIAQAIDEIFDKKVTKGIVIVKEGEQRPLKNIEVYESSHPLPDERSVIAAKKIISVLEDLTPDDYVIAAITGGSSSLVSLPPDEITIEDFRKTTKLLLESGADIAKMNTVRRHLCLMKGGRFVLYSQPATLITLTLDTAPPNMPWPDMSLADLTTFSDALDVLHTYNLKNQVPESVIKYLNKGVKDPTLETVKSLDKMNHYLYKYCSPREVCLAAANKAQLLGYRPYILSSTLEGEAKDLGIFLAGIANEILTYKTPFEAPCALISGGETTVTIKNGKGKGGPNQETAIGFALKIKEGEPVCFVSADTDGTDGPSKIAGGLVDSETKQLADKLKIDLNYALNKNNSSVALKALKSDIRTGHTGTNVMNLRIVLIGEREGN